MSLARLLIQKATVTRRREDSQQKTRHGDPKHQESEVTYPCRLQLHSARELSTDREAQVEDGLLFLPPEAVVDGTDRVRIDGQAFELVGPAIAARGARRTRLIECRVRQVKE